VFLLLFNVNLYGKDLAVFFHIKTLQIGWKL